METIISLLAVVAGFTLRFGIPIAITVVPLGCTLAG
jgi:hypothetical protein